MLHFPTSYFSRTVRKCSTQTLMTVTMRTTLLKKAWLASLLLTLQEWASGSLRRPSKGEMVSMTALLSGLKRIPAREAEMRTVREERRERRERREVREDS